MTAAPDFTALLASILRCNAVYEMDDTAARSTFANLGSTVIARYSSNTAQGVLHTASDGMLTLTVCGTRFSDGAIQARASDVFQDAEEIFVNRALAGGAVVASGAYVRGLELWSWAAPQVDRPLRIEGHSLGGQTTLALQAIVSPSLYAVGVAWEAPKTFNDIGWQAFPAKQITSVINGRDFWAAHPIESPVLAHTPGPILHLAGGTKWAWITREALPLAISTSDHNTDAVISVVRGLAA